MTRLSRPTSTWKARTSTEAGSTPPCSPPWAPARSSRRTRRSSPTATWSMPRRPQDVQVHRQRHRAPGDHRQIRRGNPAHVGLRLQLPGRHPHLGRDPEPARGRPTGASATPAATCCPTSTDFDPAEKAVAVRGHAPAAWTASCPDDMVSPPATPPSSRPTRKFEFHKVYHTLHNTLRGGPLLLLSRHHQGPTSTCEEASTACKRRSAQTASLWQTLLTPAARRTWPRFLSFTAEEAFSEPSRRASRTAWTSPRRSLPCVSRRD